MIRRLLASVREYKTASFLAPLFVVCEVILEVIIPMLMANLIDYGINKSNMPYIIQIGVTLVVCCLCSLTFGALAGKFAAKAAAGFAKNLRKDIRVIPLRPMWLISPMRQIVLRWLRCRRVSMSSIWIVGQGPGPH